MRTRDSLLPCIAVGQNPVCAELTVVVDRPPEVPEAAGQRAYRLSQIACVAWGAAATVASDAKKSHRMRLHSWGNCGGFSGACAGDGGAAPGGRSAAAAAGGAGFRGDAGRVAEPAAGPEPRAVDDREAGRPPAGVLRPRRDLSVGVAAAACR